MFCAKCVRFESVVTEMTLRYTNAEWAEFVRQTVDDLVVSQEPHPCPGIGSLAFMKTMDHTLLKLDSRGNQFDDLCAEARVDSFAVCAAPVKHLWTESADMSWQRLSAFARIWFRNAYQISKGQT